MSMLTINNTIDGYLKDIEIKGNTIQDINQTGDLADIRSVGDKLENQELYKIPVLSCGKNIYKHTMETKTVSGVTYTFNDDGTIQASGTAVNYSAYLDIWKFSETNLPEGTYTFSGATGVNYNGTYSSCPRTMTISKNDNVRLYITTDKGASNNNLYKPQIEEGTVATPYEPYQEDKLTILSPKQLKSYNGTKDRIVCKNGVWVHEENVTYDAEGNGTILSKSIDTPLPHDQQISIRTFANKTNIHFECEIEPTIKASVPKSLGATVNSHSEQISNLGKELERVKKLEESTVSTVVGDTDFISVAETTNGYFSDIKLEGRTLVVNADNEVVEAGTEGATLKSVGEDVEQISVLSTNKEETKEDEKRILYYNEETQAWEKPILREWDSIEKHSDGKYYYHKRSGEVMLNGSESWKYSETFSSETHSWFYVSMPFMKQGKEVVCDKFEYISDKEIRDVDHTYTDTDINICIAKNKLNTQGIAGFKAWLQTNPTVVVYQLKQEEVYECTNIDLITYADETNLVVKSGVLNPKVTLKVKKGIGNVVTLLQNKVAMLEDLVNKLIQSK